MSTKYDALIAHAAGLGHLGGVSGDEAKNPLTRFDAQDTIVFGRELETVEAKLYEVKYPEIKARTFFPITYPGQPTDKTFTWQQFDSQGAPVKRITNFATDFPMVSVSGEQISSTVYDFGNAYGYSVYDIRVAARTGKPLDMMLANMARRAHEIKFEQMCAGTDPEANFPSFASQAGNVLAASTAVASPNGSAWSAASGKTPEEIRKDFSSLVTSVRTASLGIYDTATNVLLPLASYTYLDTTMYTASGFSEMTLLAWIKRQFPGVQIDYWNSLSNTALAYVKSEEVLDFMIAQEVEVMPPQLRNLQFEMPLWSRVAGPRVRQPFAVSRMTGI